MREYTVANILDLLETIGEDKVGFSLSEFSCSRNAEIEDFIHKMDLRLAFFKMCKGRLAAELFFWNVRIGRVY